MSNKSNEGAIAGEEVPKARLLNARNGLDLSLLSFSA